VLVVATVDMMYGRAEDEDDEDEDKGMGGGV
jgi:hypothetical protein